MGKLGLALAGGGARGAYQVGAWKAMIEYGIIDKIDAYSGASVGSLNAVMFAMGDYQKAHDLWMSLDKDSLFNVEKQILKRIFKEKLNFFNRGVYSTKKLERLMDESIDYDILKDKEIYVSTTYVGDEKSTFFDLLRTNYEHYLKQQNKVKYQAIGDMSKETIKKTLLASCAIPVVFQPIRIGNETFFDGGILDNTPYQPLIDAGCDKVLVIDLFKTSFSRKKQVDDVKIYYVHPRRSLRGVLDFSKNQIRRRFELGYVDTCRILDEIGELLKEN